MKILKNLFTLSKPIEATHVIKLPPGPPRESCTLLCHQCELRIESNGPVEVFLAANRAGWRIFRTVKQSMQLCPVCLEGCEFEAQRNGVRYALYRFTQTPVNVPAKVTLI